MIPSPSRLALKLAIGISCVLLLVLLVHDRNHWKSKTAHYAEQLSAERSAHAATVANYRAAAERARREDATNVARVTAAQAGINERIVHDLESRIAAARAVAGRLRGNTQISTGAGGGGGAPVPVVSASAPRVAEATGEDRLSQSERLTATEQAIQLDELIKWVRQQMGVDINGTSAVPPGD